MNKKVSFWHSLSFHLALTTVGMMLSIWLTISIVLVISTARDIMDGARKQAETVCSEYRYEEHLLSYPAGLTDDDGSEWMKEGCISAYDFLFPTVNQSSDGRYTQYNFSYLYGYAPDPETAPKTLIGIRLDPTDNTPLDLRFLFLNLDRFTAEDLYDISQRIASNQTAPLPLSSTGTREDGLFQVDSLTLGNETYSAGPAVGTETISLSGIGNHYSFFPGRLDELSDWEWFLDVRDRVSASSKACPQNYIRYYDFYSSAVKQVRFGTYFNITVVMITTPLKTALQEQAPVLIRLLALIPILGIVFFVIIRRMVVLPLRDTQNAFQTVSALDFSDVQGKSVKRRDEIGQLNRSLQAMAGELRRRWDDERALERRRQEFVAAASHELKTPLALMRGYTEGLEQNIGDWKQYLAGMEREIDRMNTLVVELLEETRLERMDQLQQRDPVNLSDLVKGLLEEMAPLFQGLNLSAQLEPGVTCPGDRSLLERGVGNLLSNAARYCSPGGQVRVTLTSGPVLTVENDADPIPEEELPRLFELFYRGDKARDRSGSGLGLAIAQRIFSLHHLSCTAENIPGGVRFQLRKEETSGPHSLSAL